MIDTVSPFVSFQPTMSTKLFGLALLELPQFGGQYGDRASDSALLPALYISNSRWRNSRGYVFRHLAMAGTFCTPKGEMSTESDQLHFEHTSHHERGVECCRNRSNDSGSLC